MRGIPPVLETDSEDVAWALQTADALWQRNERVDAIVWLRRAAQAAGDSNDENRAISLARTAAELSDWMTHGSGQPASEPPRVHDSIEELLAVSREGELPPLRSAAPSAAEIHAGMLHPWADEETRELPREVALQVPPPARSDRPLVDDQEELTETVTAIGERGGRSVLPVGPNEVFDDDVITSAKGNVIRPPNVPIAPPSAPVIVSPPPSPRVVAAPPPPRPPPPPVPRKPPSPPSPPSPPVVAAPPPTASKHPGRTSETEFLSDADLVTIPPSPLSDSQTIHLPPGEGGPQDSVTTRIARDDTSGTDVTENSVAQHVISLEDSVETSVGLRADVDVYAQHFDGEDATRAITRPPIATSVDAPPENAETNEEIAPVLHESGTLATTSSVRMAAPQDSNEDLSDLAADPALLEGLPHGTPERSTDRPVAVQERGGKQIIELDGVDALSDIPDDEREQFAAQATLHDLTTDDEIVTFALALVISGDVDVVATVLDAAERLAPGTVLRSRGTNEKGFELRIVCRSEKARVATWPNAPVEAAFKSCPWVEDDLRIATDRIQALVGITSGPLADRLDASLRQEVVRRMTTRALAPGEVLVKKGEPVPGLTLVGVTGLELVDGDKVTGDVIVGDFVFPTQVLGAGAAPATVRAPSEGAVVLYADRKAAQELIVTCPPLLEILAGM